MEYVERRKLSEVLSMYELEPSLKDLYVEGVTDQIFYNKVIECSDVEIKIIDSIDFSELYEENSDLKCNNKKKVIELSNKLSSEFGITLSHICCVIDSDYDFFCDSVLWNCYLRYTDYTSLEMYFFNDSTINHFITDVLRGFPISSKNIITELTHTLTEVFFIRLALITILKDQISEINFIDFKKTMSINKNTGSISFDASIHIHKILNSSNLLNLESEVILCFTKMKDNRFKDNRFQIRGHDFTHLLFLLINTIKNHIKLSEETLERVLPLCANKDILQNESLILRLKQKYSA
jgi:hypothetical protein